jgi:hypothetical protein
MIEFVDQTFGSKFDRGTAGVIENIRCRNCEFAHCGLSLTKEIQRRTTVRNSEFIRCRVNGCDVGPAIIEDVLISDLQTNDLFILWGTLFRRVKLSGRIGKMKINPSVDAIDRSAATQSPFDEHRTRFYSETDWALDIRDARFRLFDLRGIPARLIRRNSESQVVITRERALDPAWRQRLSPSNELWPFMIDMFLADGEEDRVFVAPLDAPKPKRDLLLQQLDELRAAGVAAPD